MTHGSLLKSGSNRHRCPATQHRTNINKATENIRPPILCCHNTEKPRGLLEWHGIIIFCFSRSRRGLHPGAFKPVSVRSPSPARWPSPQTWWSSTARPSEWWSAWQCCSGWWAWRGGRGLQGPAAGSQRPSPQAGSDLAASRSDRKVRPVSFERVNVD